MIGVTSFLKNVILVNQYSYQEFYDTFNMEELAQRLEHLMLLCQMFHSNIGDRVTSELLIQWS